MASPSSLGGAIFMVLRLENRSMTSASAMMEHASSGQMGQPAACMIENNARLQTGSGAGLWRTSAGKKAAAISPEVHVPGLRASEFNAQNLWITLWASLCQDSAKPRQPVVSIERLKIKHLFFYTNQQVTPFNRGFRMLLPAFCAFFETCGVLFQHHGDRCG